MYGCNILLHRSPPWTIKNYFCVYHVSQDKWSVPNDFQLFDNEHLGDGDKHKKTYNVIYCNKSNNESMLSNYKSKQSRSL